MSNQASKPVVLIILDGWGLAPENPGNAVSEAATPNMDRFWSAYPHSQLKASGKAVGLLKNEPGSSEFGHLIIGAGRIIYQEFSRISLSINDGSFFKNKALVSACDYAQKHGSSLHLLGLLSSGTVHSSKDHLYALLHLAKLRGLKRKQVKLHLFTDGRDSPPESAPLFLSELEKVMEKIKIGEIATLSGRYYAMDRDHRWERTKKTYEALTESRGNRSSSSLKAVEEYHQKGITDEFIPPTILVNKKGKPVGEIKENDAVIFFNFRTDRARQLTKAFVKPEFYGFKRGKVFKNLFFVTMTEFEKGLPVSAVAFPSRRIDFALPRVLAENDLRQLHMAETEKYAFVTYYFNGLYEAPVRGEERILVPSPKVATYDLKPEMSAEEITKILLEKIELGIYDFIVVNFANPDMVGHTGNLRAAIRACEVVDSCVGKIVKKVLAYNGTCLITADHGNVEEMIDLKTGRPITEHSLNPVPFIIISKKWLGKTRFLSLGSLADIAPTILKILKIQKPGEMRGRALI